MIFKYIAGNNLKSGLKISNNLLLKNKIPILNYAIESSIDNNTIIKEFKNIQKNINKKCRVSLKLSLFNFDYNDIDKIVKILIDSNIIILIDAENDKNYNKYNVLTNKLINKYNKNKVSIIKTYQMYRKDSLLNLENDINLFKKNDIKLGVKLVRGAYWYEDKKGGNLFTCKYDTDLNYNEGVLKLYDTNKKSINILATHNNESINLGFLLNKKTEIFEFGHLMGMNENKFNFLIKNKQNVNVYIPYGPYKYMFPYLFRRLYENMDTIKYMF